MELLCSLWVLVVGGWAAWKGIVRVGRYAGTVRDAARARVAEAVARPRRELLECEAADAREQAEAERLRREDARAACAFLYALHAPEIAGRFPRDTFEAFVARVLRDGLPADAVERNAAELQALIRAHAEQAGAIRKGETVATVQAWYAAQLADLATVADARLRESFEALLRQKYHERMMSAMEASP